MSEPPRIASLADVRAIEHDGFALWLPHTQIMDALDDAARRHGDRPALAALGTDPLQLPRCWSYGQFVAEVRRSANLFRALAGSAAPRVALLMPPLPQAWFALWGAEAAGIACPINHALADDHLAALLNAAQVDLVVTLVPGHAAGDIGTRVVALGARCPQVRAVLTVGGSAQGTIDFDVAREAHSGEALAFTPEPVPGHDRIAALFHTGGTTGLPKLSQHTHGNQLHSAWGAARLYDATPGDVMLNGFPLFHVAGALVYGLSMLMSGAQIVLPPPAGWRDAAFVRHAWTHIRAQHVTLLAMVPTVMSALLAAPRDDGDASGVRLALTGGSPLPTELAARFEHETGIAVRNILGMTECAGVISIEPALGPRTPGSCGLPLPFSEVRVDEGGVLRLRGPNVGPGYTEVARNAGTFEEGWLVTGDIGHVDDEGRLFVTGRAKDVIIRGAHNIDPGTIEEALLQHPGVALAAAIGEPDEYAGELPVAFVVAKPGVTLDAATLLAFLAPRIPERAAIPKRVTVLATMPLTAIGKVYKPTLRLAACERTVRDRLERAGLHERMAVHGEDRGGQLVIRFVPVGARDAAMDEAVRGIMAGFALAWEFA